MAKHRIRRALDSLMNDAGKSLILIAACLGTMFTALIAIAWAATRYDLYTLLLGWGLADVYSVEAVGLYLCIFLGTQTILLRTPPRRRIGLASPAAFLAGWFIVAGVSYGWVIKSALAATAVLTLPFGGYFGLLYLGTLLGPVIAGYMTAALVLVAERLLLGRRIWDRSARPELLAHAVGFSIAAMIVFLSSHSIYPTLRDRDASASAYLGVLWPIFLAAPAAHLACVTALRLRKGWPSGAVRGSRLASVCLMAFLAIGTARSYARDDPHLLLVWPAHDFRKFAFWTDETRDAPFSIGGLEIVLPEGADPQRSWSKDAEKYDSFLLTERDLALPLAGAERVRVEIELRKPGRSYVQVVCSAGGPYDLLNCRRDVRGEGGVRTVPAYWAKHDDEIYAIPERPDVLIRRYELNLRAAENPDRVVRSELGLIDSSFPDMTVLLAASGSELSEWPEALAALDYFVQHHLRPMAE